MSHAFGSLLFTPAIKALQERHGSRAQYARLASREGPARALGPDEAAFIASRVIGIFEDSIEKLVALAALMPIVAGIGGNSGNQTITMIVRALALGQLNPSNARKLFTKEIAVSAVNGLVWGSVVGLFAYFIYLSVPLSLVMTLAMMLNLLLASIVGVLIPLTLAKLGRDPAAGSSVMITAVTDSGGFFIFLGLATIFLM